MLFTGVHKLIKSMSKTLNYLKFSLRNPKYLTYGL